VNTRGLFEKELLVAVARLAAGIKPRLRKKENTVSPRYLLPDFDLSSHTTPGDFG